MHGSYSALDDGKSVTSSSASSHSPRLGRTRSLAHKAKSKAKRLFGDAKTSQDPPAHGQDAGADIFTDAAFNPDLALDGNPPNKVETLKGKIHEGIHVSKQAIIHPRRNIRSQATKTTAGKLSQVHDPIVSISRDQELLEAQDDLSKELSSTVDHFNQELHDSKVEDARKRVEKLESERATLKSAWTLSRHVMRARVVRPMPFKPRKAEFISPATIDRPERFEWERWLAYLALWYLRDTTAQYIDDFNEPPFDIGDLTRIVERIAITSAPWQAFFVDLRKVYRWEDPKRTAKWAVLFWTLWYTQHLVGYFYFWVVYSTIRNRLYPSSVQSLRESVRRALDSEAKAQAWTDLVHQHGGQDWIEPMVNSLGPLIQLHLGDIADFLEVLTNFHRWVLPRKTAGSVLFFTVCLSITLLADMAFCVKLFTFIIGIMFFVSFPIRSRYPKYRILMNALRWIFWDIPTHAELGIIELQEKSIVRDAEWLDQQHLDKLSSSDNDSDFGETASHAHGTRTLQRPERYSFRAYSDTHKGTLIVTRSGFQYRQGTMKYKHAFSDISEMRKSDVENKRDKITGFQGSSAGLKFVFLNGHVLSLIVRQTEQNKIFNLVLGWSGLKWQTLLMERHADPNTKRTNLDRTIKRAIG